MNTELMRSNSVIKLKGILESRYGLGLEIISMSDATHIDMSQQFTIQDDGELHVPIIARDKYLGTAVVQRASQLSHWDIAAVSEIIRLVLEPALFSLYLSRQVAAVEANFNSQSSEKNIVDNVTFLSNFSFDDSVGKSHLKNDQDDFSKRTEFTVAGVLLESRNPHKISRAAVHVHEIGSRWAMLNWNDIKSSIHSIKDLQELGPMTIFIQDILVLSPEEQSLLTEYISQANSITEPLILIGGTSSILDLMDRKMIHEGFGFSLLRNRIELDRLPTDFSMMKDALELLLDRKVLLN